MFWGIIAGAFFYIAHRRLSDGRAKWAYGIGGEHLSMIEEGEDRHWGGEREEGGIRRAVGHIRTGRNLRGGGGGRGVATKEEDDKVSMYNACKIKVPNWTWEDLFPSGTLNGWTGSQDCPTERPFASWDDEAEDGRIGIDCPEHQKASAQVLPRTEDYEWTLPRFQGVQEFQKHVLQHSRLVTSDEDAIATLDGRRSYHAVDNRSEAVLVRCGDSQQNLLIRTVRDEVAAERVRAYHQQLDEKAALEHLEELNRRGSMHQSYGQQDPPTRWGPRPKVNVLLLYLDAISRRHFHRRFPTTAAFLNKLKKEREDDLVVTEFFRYHAIGITTSRNARAMFTGFSLRPSSVEDLPYLNSIRFSRNEEMPPPNYPVPIWEAYKRKGFVTAQIDNSCQDWEAKYVARSSHGWDHQFVAPFCLPEYFPLKNPHGNWVGPFAIRRRCLAGSQVHQW